MKKKSKNAFLARSQRYIFAGILTVIPLALTYKVFEFFLQQLSEIGKPWAQEVIKALQQQTASQIQWITAPWFINSLAVILTVFALYILGWITTRMLGRRLLGLFEFFIHRIPLVQSVYGAIKKFISVLQTKPDQIDRVVLIEFPSSRMKTVGFVTRVLTDSITGQQLATVYVPTTPIPTSGYLEIIPVENLVATDWTMDEAMTFIISGGAVAPDHIRYDNIPKS